MKDFLILLILCFNISQLTAQTMSSLPLAKLETLHSDIVGEDYKLQITLPFGHDPNGGKKYPVFYYLDAWGTSGTINEFGLARMWSKSIDPIILVGISYETNPFLYGKLRERDYIPPLNESDKMKGGDKFLQFIKTELIPFMEKNYASNPEDRGLIGYSYGGLFSTWALKKELSLFHKLGIISPALWYVDEFLLKDEELLSNIKNAKNLKIFIACGAEEGENMISNTNSLFDLFKKNKNIQSQKVIFADEDLGSVFLAATARGIRYLYKNKYKALLEDGTDYYKKKAFAKALKSFEKAFASAPKQVREGDRYNIACFYALVNDSENAFRYLQIIADSKYDNYKHITTDTDFNSLHKDKRWEGILAKVKMNEESASKK